MAYDRIMDFPGRFSDHILPDKIHMLNVCFTINGLKENFGGTAGNIAYTLALLGESPNIVATAGSDFEPYRRWLAEHGITSDAIRIIGDELTAGAYITTDQSDNQITAFNPGAMKHSSILHKDILEPERCIAIVAPGNLDDMFNFSAAYKETGVDYVFDPGQSLPGWTDEQLREMIDGSKIFICNDYELELTMDKTSLTTEGILGMTEVLIATKGEQGSVIMYRQDGETCSVDIPAVKADRVKDPTGAGDAYRAGLIKGLLTRKGDIRHAAMIGATSASYSVEVYGTQNFSFTADQFNQRFENAFGVTAI